MRDASYIYMQCVEFCRWMFACRNEERCDASFLLRSKLCWAYAVFFAVSLRWPWSCSKWKDFQGKYTKQVAKQRKYIRCNLFRSCLFQHKVFTNRLLQRIICEGYKPLLLVLTQSKFVIYFWYKRITADGRKGAYFARNGANYMWTEANIQRRRLRMLTIELVL